MLVCGVDNLTSMRQLATKPGIDVAVLSQAPTASEFKSRMHHSKESFEEVPLYTAVMTYIGFYLLVILGYLNQMLFAPKVAKESGRKVNIHISDCWHPTYSRIHRLNNHSSNLPTIFLLALPLTHFYVSLTETISILCNIFIRQGKP